MSKIINLDTVNDYCKRFGQTAQHPLVGVMNLYNAKRESQKGIEALRFKFYAIFLKQNKNCILKYGRKYYDFQEGTMVFIGPGQVVQIENGDNYVPSGHALLFHPDLLLRTNLGELIKEYNFFSYELNEALHVSEKERKTIIDCIEKIGFDLERDIDKHTKELIVSNIELFLRYCSRFYNCQFITRDVVNDGVVSQFRKSLHNYFHTGRASELGCPSVSYFAQEQFLSPNYLGTLSKKKWGKVPQN